MVKRLKDASHRVQTHPSACNEVGHREQSAATRDIPRLKTYVMAFSITSCWQDWLLYRQSQLG